MQIVLFLIFILLILLVIIAKKDSLSKSNKIALSITSAIVLVIIGFYQHNINTQGEYERKIVNAYEQGKMLKCGDYVVNKKKYLYVSGTQNFMPKEDQEEIRGVIINVSDCSIAE